MHHLGEMDPKPPGLPLLLYDLREVKEIEDVPLTTQPEGLQARRAVDRDSTQESTQA